MPPWAIARKLLWLHQVAHKSSSSGSKKELAEEVIIVSGAKLSHLILNIFKNLFFNFQ
jgi:hypothetical protein